MRLSSLLLTIPSNPSLPTGRSPLRLTGQEAGARRSDRLTVVLPTMSCCALHRFSLLRFLMASFKKKLLLKFLSSGLLIPLFVNSVDFVFVAAAAETAEPPSMSLLRRWGKVIFVSV